MCVLRGAAICIRGGGRGLPGHPGNKTSLYSPKTAAFFPSIPGVPVTGCVWRGALYLSGSRVSAAVYQQEEVRQKDVPLLGSAALRGSTPTTAGPVHKQSVAVASTGVSHKPWNVQRKQPPPLPF